jgi:peptidoglycan hydrolase CwlO-like protein
MRSQRVAQAIQSEEVDEMNMEERVGKLEVKVDHIQSDVTELKTDVRELRGDVKTVRAEVHTLGTELRAEIHAFKVGLEKRMGQIWVALAVLIVLQLLAMGGVPAAIARAFKFL